MLKKILLVGAAAFSLPAIAQVTEPEGTTGHDATAPMDHAGPTQQVTSPAEAAPAASTDQVRAVVDREFANYDADSSGDLNQAEFTAWMNSLRAAANTPPADDPAAWSAAAFKMADADGSGAVSKDELVTFLSRAK